jgi:SAM-dependent methyltransferase
MTWFWRLVCSPDCTEACQSDCPGCYDLTGEWQQLGSLHMAGPAARPRWRWSRFGELWACWSRSTSAKLFDRVSPVKLARTVTGCACEPAPQPALIRHEVKRSYGAQAVNVMAGVQDGCCSPGLPADASCASCYSSDDLATLPAGALASATGCGNPLVLAGLQHGEVVLELGSSGGMDALLAAAKVGLEGQVYAVVLTSEMVDLGRANASQVGARNVVFLQGDLDAIPLPDESVDVIISNCAVNLAPEKEPVFREAYRVLRPGGRLCFSDVVTRHPVPPAMKADLTLWSACVAGALSETQYVDAVRGAGFADAEVVRERDYTARDAEGAGLAPFLRKYGTDLAAGLGFGSGRVSARKPSRVPATTVDRPLEEVNL